jgi:SAM-dependent methyltransferase
MDWNSRYLKEDIPWEKGGPTPVLKEIEQKMDSGVWTGGPVLVPGCGFGHDARWLASRGVSVWGLDIAEEAVLGARKMTEGSNPTFEEGDFFQPAAAAVNVIFEHTCFCAIEPSRRKDYVDAAATWLPSGGLLVGVFFLNPDHEKDGPPYGVTVAELDEYFSPAFDVVDEWDPTTGYPERIGREWARVMVKR